jgi:hypothetical protein
LRQANESDNNAIVYLCGLARNSQMTLIILING